MTPADQCGCFLPLTLTSSAAIRGVADVRLLTLPHLAVAWYVTFCASTAGLAAAASLAGGFLAAGVAATFLPAGWRCLASAAAWRMAACCFRAVARLPTGFAGALGALV